MAKFLTDKKLAGSILLVILLWISAILWNFDVSIGRFNINWLYFVFFKLLPALGILYIFLAFLLKKWWLILIGLACLFSFFISMFLGYLFLGP